MVSLTRYPISSLILALIGLLVVLFGIYAVPHPLETEYRHTVFSTHSDRVPSEAEVINYSNLSPAGQSVFDESLQSDADKLVLYGESRLPSEFTYLDVQSPFYEMYYIWKGGEYYEFYTSKKPPRTLDFVVLGGCLLIGGCLIGISFLGQIKRRKN